MLTVLTLLKLKPSPNGEKHGERAFWQEFGLRYLGNWLNAVARFVPQPHQVRVMTDHDGLLQTQVDDDGVEYVPLGRIVDAPGFWAKLEAFRYAPGGKCLYLDLDNVINGPLDELCALEPDPLIMLDDRRVPGLPNGSAILFDAERCRWLWKYYTDDPETCHASYVARGDDYSNAYDQAFIAKNVAHWHGPPETFQELLPKGYILNARSELPNAPDWRTARLVFGGGAEGKPHLSNHPAFSLR
jgi:hypothetical protein